MLNNVFLKVVNSICQWLLKAQNSNFKIFFCNLMASTLEGKNREPWRGGSKELGSKSKQCK
jgi:hypothetical protein